MKYGIINSLRNYDIIVVIKIRYDDNCKIKRNNDRNHATSNLKFSQENTIQKWTLTTQIQTTIPTNSPRNKNTNNTIPTPKLKYNTIQIINWKPNKIKG